MNYKKSLLIVCVLCCTALLITRCNSNSDTDTAHSVNISPKELPVLVPGFHFPEDSNRIYSWMNDKNFPNNYDSASIYSHAWGIWAGLTANSGEIYAGDSLLVFETWLGISEIQDMIKKDNPDGGCAGNAKHSRALLSRANQLKHGFNRAQHTDMKISNSMKTPIDTNANSSNSNFWVTVSYDPNAACYATKNSILKQSVLDKYAVSNGIGSIPSFPTKSITIKPAYYVGRKTDDLIRIFVWSGPPNPAKAYPDTIWPTVVYADVHNKQGPNKKLTPAPVSATDKKVIDAATCNLSDFIYFKLDSAMAKHMNEADKTEDGPSFASAGDIAILMGMHVTTKEINNWTWQSYYWSPNPAHPFFPSSDLAASLMPKQLQGAASHYAVATGYCMVIPNQPIIGGTNVGKSPMFGWNPYLEAGFSGLASSPLIPGSQFGIQTNCMSCHIMATSSGKLPYNTAQYISLDDTIFKNQVHVDFAWSIANNKIPIDTGKNKK